MGCNQSVNNIKTMKNLSLILFVLCTLASGAYSQQIKSNSIIATENLKEVLKSDIKSALEAKGNLDQEALAQYFRTKFSERYYYDWQTFDNRFKQYNKLYSRKSSHQSRAEDHMNKFADSTQWVLPFNYLNGDPVNAYALRHLARSHKMVDVAFQYFYDNEDPKYINYFVRQVSSLNAALAAGAYEKIEDGNGVYEVYRSGYRVLNWLRVHNMFLGEDAYTDADQLNTIATMLQHGQDLYENNDKFRSGNHQTKGMSALAMLAILFRDFEGTDKWYDRAMTRLDEHMDREINDDGFQFERSVHYHISDIDNYFYLYQLAKISEYKLSESWENSLQSLFKTLTMIAYPDKSAPVLQDDTDRPWAEVNDIGSAMTIGYALYGNPEYGYFANKKVDSNMYWFLKGKQVDMLKKIEKSSPKYKSIKFDDTGYYIMREGWKTRDKMLIISAGLDDKKPDHQHGDMLGVQVMSNGYAVLPNYQVRYSLPDYEFFKNSMVKNVALVDDEMQGKEYKGNRGGSGFGKFHNLPNPSVIRWQTGSDEDVFIGSHDGFENIGVKYSRQVIFVDDDFWIVKDNFTSSEEHAYKQVWQGHYSIDKNPELIRSSFSNGSGLDILQLNGSDKIEQDGTRGKGWSVFINENEKNFSFITILHPFSTFDRCLDTAADNLSIKGWSLSLPNVDAGGKNFKSLSKGAKSYLLGVERINHNGQVLEFNLPTDVICTIDNDNLILEAIGDNEVSFNVSGKKKYYLNNELKKKESMVKPGDILKTANK